MLRSHTGDRRRRPRGLRPARAAERLRRSRGRPTCGSTTWRLPALPVPAPVSPGIAVAPGPAAGRRQGDPAGPLPVCALRQPRVRHAAGPRDLSDSVLLADGEPIFPRVIQYQGEPLPLLKQLGFNAIWLAELPSPAVARGGAAAGAVAGLPAAAACPSRPPSGAGGPGRVRSRVSAGPGLGPRQRPDRRTACRRASGGQSRSMPPTRRQHRPLLCSPRNDLRGYSRQVDLLLIDRRPLGSSMELADYGAWVRRQPLLALPGTPVWTTVQTQPNEGLRRQLAALQPGRPLPGAVPGEQIRLLAYTAISAGSRGLVFLSRSPLSATDPETRQRAMDLELLNLELRMIEPWAAAGPTSPPRKRPLSIPRPINSPTPETAGATRVCPERTSIPSAQGRRRRQSGRRPAAAQLPEVTGAVLRLDRARLVLPLWSSPGGPVRRGAGHRRQPGDGRAGHARIDPRLRTRPGPLGAAAEDEGNRRHPRHPR